MDREEYGKGISVQLWCSVYKYLYLELIQHGNQRHLCAYLDLNLYFAPKSTRIKMIGDYDLDVIQSGIQYRFYSSF